MHISIDFECSNAREWDDESALEVPPSTRPTETPNLVPASAPVVLRTADPALTRHNNGASSSRQRRSGAVPQHPPQGRKKHQNFGQKKPPTTSRARDNAPKAIWAEAEGLVTNKLKDERELKVHLDAQKKIYLDLPDKDEEFLTNGFYLWTDRYRTPTDVLGSNLEGLNTLRAEYEVYIRWDVGKSCLVITSHVLRDSDYRMAGVVRGIRRAIAHALAKSILATPVYVVTPPTAENMRRIVRPKGYQSVDQNGKPLHPPIVLGVELSGPMLAKEEREVWHSQWVEKMQSRNGDLRKILIEKITALATLGERMHMRIHFGDLELSYYREDFASSKSGFDAFAKMMRNPRVMGQFNKRLTNATTAMVLRENMFKQPGIFAPTDPTLLDLRDVEFKHTEIIFVTNSASQNIRIETVVDKAFAISGHYQVGTSKVFWENTTNKRVDVVMIDLERGIDWNLEIITDGTTDIPGPLRKLIEGSLPTKDTERVDLLGLTYPAISLPSYDGVINHVTLRSIALYQMKDSGYVVEIAIYRDWNGRHTRPDPKMSCSVSMYHPVWDLEMESIEDTTKERGWDRHLKRFFGTSVVHTKSLEHFLSAVGIIHDLVAVASKDLDLDQNVDYVVNMDDSPTSIKGLSLQKKKDLLIDIDEF